MEQNKSKFFGGVCGLMTAFGLITCVISLMNGSNSLWLICDCGNSLLNILILYYAFIGYKTPHGNLLKYILLLFAARGLLTIQVLSQLGLTWRIVLDAIQLGLICYTAGRLHKINENRISMMIVTITILIAIISDGISGITTIGLVSPLIIWLDICVAYFLRYKEHKEAAAPFTH